MIPWEIPKLSHKLLENINFLQHQKNLMLLRKEAQEQNVVTTYVHFCLPDIDCPSLIQQVFKRFHVFHKSGLKILHHCTFQYIWWWFSKYDQYYGEFLVGRTFWKCNVKHQIDGTKEVWNNHSINELSVSLAAGHSTVAFEVYCLKWSFVPRKICWALVF